MRWPLVLSVVLAACGDPADPDCLVRISDTTIMGNTMTANGTFITAQPLLVLSGAAMRLIPGQDDGQGHATFDLTGLPAGRYEYKFQGSCFDPDAEPTVDAPTGFFTR